MSRIPQGKVLVKAGKFEGGKLPYLNYVGQIKPADLPRILWWGDFGDDTTGDGTIATPYETFQKALDEFSTTTHKWILKTDLSVYGEAGPGPYIDDPADRVYLDPTRPDDSGDGLTPEAAKQTYAAAKTALSGSGRSVIHCIGSFTLSDLIDAPTQGEIGETLTYNVAPELLLQEVESVASTVFLKVIQTSTGALIAIGRSPTLGTRIYRSTNGGESWTAITNPWSSTRNPSGIAIGGSTMIVSGVGGTSVNQALRSTDDGVTWSAVTIVGGATVDYCDVVWSGSQFVVFKVAQTEDNNSQWVSADGVSWTPEESCLTFTAVAAACDGSGNIILAGSRSSGTIDAIIRSPNHGVSWTDISGFTGVGINTGGMVFNAVEYNNGRWFAFQDTLSVAIYHSDAPASGAWSTVSDTLQLANTTNYNRLQVGYSTELGKYIYAPTTSILSEIHSIDQSEVSVLASIPALDQNYGTFCFNYNGREYLLILGCNASSVGKILRSPIGGFNVRETFMNFSMASDIAASVRESVIIQNFTIDNAGKSLSISNDCKAECGYVSSESETALEQFGNSAKIRRNVIISPVGAVVSNGTAANQDDIEISQNVIIGGLALNNSGGTDKELIQDNIIEGNFTASAITTVRSNIRGAVVNASGLSKISSINPIFVDEIDYELSRIALGQSIDSPLVKRSAVYSYLYDSVTYPDDFGPYRAFVALVQTSYKRAFLLPKFSGNALSEDIENAAALLRSINGVPDVSNRPEGRLEILSWASKSVDAQVREFISFIERERNTQCEIYIDYDESVLDDIEVDGVHTSGTFEVNIQPKDVPVGAVLSLFGKLRYVVQRYPRSGEATKLILDDVLYGGLSDGQAIEIEQLQGAGTFVFVPEQRRQNVRVFSRRRDTYTGMKYTFARKAL